MQECLLSDNVVKSLPHAKLFKCSGFWIRWSSVSIWEMEHFKEFLKELVRSCNLPIKKRRAKGAAAWTNFCISFDNI